MIDPTYEVAHTQIRWRIGHHLFFSWVQSLMLTFERLQQAIDQNDFTAAERELNRATQILWGISVTFKLTGDFSATMYENHIRPSMVDFADGFSGMWAYDHDFMIKNVMKRLKKTFDHPPAELEPAMRKFRQAFAIMYDSHKFVCEQFEADAPSLLMGEKAQKSAIEIIDSFKQKRLMMLGVPR
ncbi:MAG: hypothetical protein AAGD96_13570 [Chloroflexota bacterium]